MLERTLWPAPSLPTRRGQLVMSMSLSEEILSFWFGELEGPHDVGPNAKMWWMKDAALDAQIRDRFAVHVEKAAAGDYDGWLDAPRSTLALVILLDQFSRNIFRDSPKAWENDARAQALTFDAISRGHDRELATVERQFLYMPLLHSEDLALHERMAALLHDTLAEVPEGAREAFAGWARSLAQHTEIVRRFGRYPHRNAVLGRPSTEAEEAFLKTPGSSF